MNKIPTLSIPKLKHHHKASCRICSSKNGCYTLYLDITGRSSICYTCKQQIYNESFKKYISIIYKQKLKKSRDNQRILARLIIKKNINISDKLDHNGFTKQILCMI